METNAILELINKNALVIFSATYCPHCKDVKEALNNITDEDLKEKIKDQNVIELDTLASNDLKESLKKYTGCRTIPQVFIKGKFVGGCSDVKSLIKDNLLREKFA